MLTENGPRTDVSDITTNSYDLAGNLTGTTNAAGHQTQYSLHDGNGRPGRITDANGNITDLIYDGVGRLTEAIRRSPAGDLSTRSSYDLDGRLQRVTLPDSTFLEYGYDAAERVDEISNNSGERIEISYDAMGNPVASRTKTAGGLIAHQLDQVNDELGRVRQVTTGASHATAFGYDVEDNPVTVTDALARTTTTGYDLFNRATSETDALTGVAAQGYDAQDNAISVTDQRTLATGFVYNGFEEVIQQTSPDTGTTIYVRDKAGNVTSRTDARGIVTQASYDALDRLTAVTYPGAPAENLSFGYDSVAGGNKGIGRLTSMTDRAGSAAYSYDDRDDLVSETRTIGAQTYTTGYAYDASGRPFSITYPSGRVIEISRDALGRVETIATRDTSGGALRPVASGALYKPFGPLAQLQHVSGLTTTWAYDLDYRMTGIIATDGTTAVQQLAIGWDGADNVISLTDALAPARSQVFGYDELYRLDTASGAYGAYDWAHDAVGNRTGEALTVGGSTSTKTYTPATTSNQLTGITGAESRAFTYSASGNLASDSRGPPGADDLTFSYGSADRLVTVSDASGVVQSAVYDGLGRRISRTAGGVTRHYHYDRNDRLIASSSATGGDWVEWLWLDDAASPIAQIENGQIYAIHADHLGQPQKMTDAAKGVVWDRQALPYGQTFAETGPLANPLRFPGQLTDPATATHYNMARDYDPSLGRYLQSDPIGLEGGLNTYGYTGGNPQTYFDELGLSRGQVRRPPPQGRAVPPILSNLPFPNQWQPAPGSPASRIRIISNLRSTSGRGALQAAQADAANFCLSSGQLGARYQSGQPKYGRYEFPDLLAVGRQYVGSGNIPRRLSDHLRAGRYQPGTESVTPVFSGRTAREIAEHRRIQEITGGVPARQSDRVSNERDPIGPRRQHLLGD